MSRTERLFDLLQLLRHHRYPVSAQQLATNLDVSLRTLYRDIASLKAQGAEIEGEPGIGYVLRPSFMLPPLMFTHDELEALILGTRWVSKKTDSDLREASQHALAKIAAVLPQDLRQQLELSSLLIGPSNLEQAYDNDLKLIREAIRSESKLQLKYHSLDDKISERIIWPIGIGFFEQVRLIISWCELREDFRHFRADRIIELSKLSEHYSERKANLMKRWREQHNIPPQY